MNVTILQTDILWAQPEANRQRISRLIDSLGPTDLIVLPEMFSTGFATQPEGIAEGDGGSLRWMAAMAASTQAAVAGSIAIQEGECYYNRFYFVKPTGEVACYDKRHLFTYGGEDKAFTPGRDRVVVEWRGVVCASCCRYATTFGSRCSVATTTTTTWCSMWPTGLRGAARPGTYCYVPAPSRTSVMWLV